MTSLAQRYSISDVALAKVCRKLRVPIPPRGYWARISSGQFVTRPSLPSSPKGLFKRLRCLRCEIDRGPISTRGAVAKGFEADPSHRVSEECFSQRFHPLVAKTKTILQGSELRVHHREDASHRHGESYEQKAPDNRGNIGPFSLCKSNS